MTDHLLRKAIRLWVKDLQIPLTLEAALLSEGYDVATLEAKYRANAYLNEEISDE